ncbi:MAG: hydroxymethylbilane synthase [Candidatus Pelagibacter sp. TMED165]|nr:MAG: hydroxymethylbilane synthase [Candidatus Pelagibacter sp. TMED165]
MGNKLIIGSRGSRLSLAYANIVKEKILSIKDNQTEKVEIKIIKTTGDMFPKKKMSEIGGKNLFCKKIEDQLLKKNIDIAVHSLKDMETNENKKLLIGSYIKRNDPRDALIQISKKKFSKLNNCVIGTSSRRRELQFNLMNKNIYFKNIRGNVDSRVKKVLDGSYDGAILALAGLKILKLDKHVTEIFSKRKIIPAAGQGVIAAQCRKNDNKIKAILQKINHHNTEICSKAEKGLLKSIGGDCHTALGALAVVKKKKLIIEAELFSDDGTKCYRIKKSGKINNPSSLGFNTGKKLLELIGKQFKKKL